MKFLNSKADLETNEDRILCMLRQEYSNTRENANETNVTLTVPANISDLEETWQTKADILSAPIDIKEDGVWHEIILNQHVENTASEEQDNTTDYYLYYPSTPQRKGNKNSFFYNDFGIAEKNHEEKEQKLKDLIEKEKRKKERELKKAAGKKKLMKKKLNKTKFQKHQTC